MRSSWFVLFCHPSGRAGRRARAGRRHRGFTVQPPFRQRTPLSTGTTEWMVGAGPAFGMQLFHSVGGHRYVLQTLSWGRVLTEPHGPGWLRGRFELAFEVVPIYGQYDPRSTYGFGITPLMWRWNFEPRQKLASFVEAGWRRAVDSRRGPGAHDNLELHRARQLRHPLLHQPVTHDQCGLSLSPHLERQPARAESRRQRARRDGRDVGDPAAKVKRGTALSARTTRVAPTPTA